MIVLVPFDYDAFLSYNRHDASAVEDVAGRLTAEGNLRVFLEKWCLIPGEPWQDEIERALDRSATCVVFVGPHGPSPWAHIVMRAFACLHALDMTGTACLCQSRSKSHLPVRHS